MEPANPDIIAILDAIVSRFVGPWGAVFLLVVVVYFLWRLFREKERDLRASDERVDRLTEAVRELTIELRALSAAPRRSR